MASKQNADFLARLQSREQQPNQMNGSRYSTSPRQPTSTLNLGSQKNTATSRGGALPPLPGRQPPPGPGFLATSLSGRNLKIPPPNTKTQQQRGGGRKSKRVYPGTSQSAGGNVGGFQGSGTGFRPSAGGIMCFTVGLVIIITSVLITSYSILSNEKNVYGMAIATNKTLFFKHISQTPDAGVGGEQARVGIHNSKPQATLEITTHGDDVNQDSTTLRLSRVVGEDVVAADVTRTMESTVEFGYYSVVGNVQTWVPGAQVSSDVHSGSLRLSAGSGNTTKRRRRNLQQRHEDVVGTPLLQQRSSENGWNGGGSSNNGGNSKSSSSNSKSSSSRSSSSSSSRSGGETRRRSEIETFNILP